jgi:vancomycin resistance protein YoaR
MLYVAGWWFTGDRVPNGTVVAGEDLGGLTSDAAEQRLERRLDPWLTSPVELTYTGKAFEVVPAEAGLGFDIEETLSRAGGGRTWNPVRMVDTLFGSEEQVDPVLTVDEPALSAAVETIGDQIDRQPVEPAVTFSASGEARIVEPRVGLSLDAAQAAQAVVDKFLARSGDGILPVDTVQPAVHGQEWRRAQRELVRPATSAPIRLDLSGRSLRLAVRDYAPSLSFDVTDETLTAAVDVDRLRKDLAPALQRVATAPIDAAVVLRGGRPAVVPAEPGVTVDIEEVADAIILASSRTGQERTARVEGTRTLEPDFTTREARQLGIKRVVSSFVTYFPYAEYRNINQARAAELINGTVLLPGELFSFNDTVGERTRENGFTVGFVIKDGVFAEDLGGGVSQVVTTTYNAAFFAGLDDVEHTPHSFYIDRYPMGREATVSWPSVDLKFRNNTPYGVLIQAWVVPSTVTSQGEMHVRMWSTKYWDIRTRTSEPYNFTSHSTRYDPTDECVATTGYGGFDVDVYRTFVRAGSEDVVRREQQHVSYTPADTVICGPEPR